MVSKFKVNEDSGSPAKSEHHNQCYQIKRCSDKIKSLWSILLWGYTCCRWRADRGSCVSVPWPKAVIPSARDAGRAHADYGHPQDLQAACREAGLGWRTSTDRRLGQSLRAEPREAWSVHKCRTHHSRSIAHR